MTADTTVRYFEFSAAGAGPWVPASTSMLVQSTVAVTVEAVTLVGTTVATLGSVAAGDSGTFSTAHAFVRVVAGGAGSASIAKSFPVGAGGGGGGGGAVTVADGADTALGARNQAAATDDTGTWSLIQLVKRLLTRVATAAKQDTTNARLSRMGGLAVAEVDTVSDTTYVLYRSSIDSAMSYVVVRSVVTGGATAVRYAGVVNNPTMTTSAAAWAARATLVYGSLAEA